MNLLKWFMVIELKLWVSVLGQSQYTDSWGKVCSGLIISC